MDEERFDRLAKAAACGGLSRRVLLRGVGGGLVAALLGGEAEARRRRDGAGQGTFGASGTPGATGGSASSTTSDTGSNGANGGSRACTPVTSCPSGQTCGTAPDGCGGTLHCGDCAGAACSTGSCQNGQCVLNPIAGCCTGDSDCDDGNA